MMNFRCLFSHDFVKVRTFDKKQELKEGWVGDPGYEPITVFECSRSSCKAKKEVTGEEWHKMRFCEVCQKETRQRSRIFSDVDNKWDDWHGQGDGTFFWKCLDCQTIVPPLSVLEAYVRTDVKYIPYPLLRPLPRKEDILSHGLYGVSVMYKLGIPPW